MTGPSWSGAATGVGVNDASISSCGFSHRNPDAGVYSTEPPFAVTSPIAPGSARSTVSMVAIECVT